MKEIMFGWFYKGHCSVSIQDNVIMILELVLVICFVAVTWHLVSRK